MSIRLTLVEAARKSGIGLHSLMKAVRSGELEASRETEGGYSVTERDLVNFQKKRPSLSDILGAHQLQTDQPIAENVKETGDALKRVRGAFAHIPPQSEPELQSHPVEPSVAPARDLQQWCDSYLNDLRKVDWCLRKLKADAEWASRHVAPDTVLEADNLDKAEDVGIENGKSLDHTSKS